MGGIFELRDYRDLMAKLERDLEAITENPRDSGFAFNFFVTAWHLLEWVYPDDVAKRVQIRDASILLQISEHIAVGAYFFALSLVPIAWYESQPKPVKLTRDQNQNVIETWWEHHEPAISTVDYFDEQLIRVDGSPYEHELKDTVWTDEHHHQVELWEYEADGVAHLDIKIDARYSYADFLAKVLKFAIRANCMFYFCHEETFVELSSIAVFEALDRSPAASLANRQKRVSKVH